MILQSTISLLSKNILCLCFPSRTFLSMAFNTGNDNINTTGENGAVAMGSGPVMVETYSVVLSVAALVLATIFGGGGSIAVLVAIFQSRQVKKYSYTLVLVLFFLCCGMDLVWSPIEVVHLLAFHYTHENPTLDFGVATFAIYVLLSAGTAALVAVFCQENILRLCGCFHDNVKRVWPLGSCAFMFTVSILLAVSYLVASIGDGKLEEDARKTFLVLDESSSVARVAVLAVMMVLVVGGLVGLVMAAALAYSKTNHKSSESFMSGHSNESNNILPHFLINQTDAEPSNEDTDKISNTPSSPRLPEIISPNDGGSSSPTPGVSSEPRMLNDLPAPPQRSSNMLGVNMAQVLGRRRHTICQIGDSSTGSTLDPTAKAKQYNYVRKFSVDVSALQAQLENPKSFKDKVPFQSDQDLRPHLNKTKPSETRIPFLPLSPLGPKPMDTQENKYSDASGLKLAIPPRPPVITVSEEVKEEPEKEIEEAKEEKVKESDLGAVQAPAANSFKLYSFPIMQIKEPLHEEEEEENESAQEDEEEDTSCKSETNAANNRLSERDQDFIKLSLLMCLTFFICTFPLFLIESLKARVDVHTYVNIATCARALSTIQTIIYPHILICMDAVVSKAVNRLKTRLSWLCSLHDGDCMEIQTEQGSSSTSQV